MKEIKKFNDIDRDFLEEFISDLPSEDKDKLKEYINNNPRSSTSAFFTMVKSYIYNTYFRRSPVKERKKVTFADTVNLLLQNDDDMEEEDTPPINDD